MPLPHLGDTTLGEWGWSGGSGAKPGVAELMSKSGIQFWVCPWLCDLGRVTPPLWTSVSTPQKRG